MWDQYKACENLALPYSIRELPKNIGGFMNVQDRYVVIRADEVDNKRVWIHEMAHALLHYQNFEALGAVNKIKNALNEIQADTVAYVVCRVLGLENNDYINYCASFSNVLPLSCKGHLLDNQVELIKNTAIQILNAGGYYVQR